MGALLKAFAVPDLSEEFRNWEGSVSWGYDVTASCIKDITAQKESGGGGGLQGDH